jgi:hypothetical protein
MEYFGGFFAKLRHFAGFSLFIINNSVRISAAAMGGAGDIIFIKKKVRTYGRTGIYINFEPKWIKIDLVPSKNPSK